MRNRSDGVELSASDLAGHLGCRHLTALDLAAANGDLAPPIWYDPGLEALQERGQELEQLYLDHLRAQGLTISMPGPHEDGAALERTLAALHDGADVIYQATLAHGRWRGRADFLQRTDSASDLGPWSYEVVDAKLVRLTRAGTILQLCLYSEIIGGLQGLLPARMHVVTPADLRPVPFRVHDYLAFHRLMQRRLAAAVDVAAVGRETYPDPVAQCDFCRWWRRCDDRRRGDDHLCFVAGIARLQIDELRGRGIATLAALADMPLPLDPKPARGAEDTYARVREQARVQLAGRRRAAPSTSRWTSPRDRACAGCQSRPKATSSSISRATPMPAAAGWNTSWAAPPAVPQSPITTPAGRSTPAPSAPRSRPSSISPWRAGSAGPTSTSITSRPMSRRPSSA